jgi:hypothetical protein
VRAGADRSRTCRSGCPDREAGSGRRRARSAHAAGKRLAGHDHLAGLPATEGTASVVQTEVSRPCFRLQRDQMRSVFCPGSADHRRRRSGSVEPGRYCLDQVDHGLRLTVDAHALHRTSVPEPPSHWLSITLRRWSRCTPCLHRLRHPAHPSCGRRPAGRRRYHRRQCRCHPPPSAHLCPRLRPGDRTRHRRR